MLLGVNIDHIATVRNARGTIYPSPVEAALIAETHGADLITMHLREDRRHIKDADVFAVKNAIRTRLNLEMALTEEMLENALNVMPEDVCIVPEKRQEVTTEGGLDVLAQQDKVAEFMTQASACPCLSMPTTRKSKPLMMSARPLSNCTPVHMPMRTATPSK